jgi:hypothetical protein
MSKLEPDRPKKNSRIQILIWLCNTAFNLKVRDKIPTSEAQTYCSIHHYGCVYLVLEAVVGYIRFNFEVGYGSATLRLTKYCSATLCLTKWSMTKYLEAQTYCSWNYVFTLFSRQLSQVLDHCWCSDTRPDWSIVRSTRKQYQPLDFIMLKNKFAAEIYWFLHPISNKMQKQKQYKICLCVIRGSVQTLINLSSDCKRWIISSAVDQDPHWFCCQDPYWKCGSGSGSRSLETDQN